MIPSVAQETIVHICVRNCMILCFVLFSLCFFSPQNNRYLQYMTLELQ